MLDLARADAIGQVTGWHPAPSRPLPSFRDDRRQPRPMPRMIEFPGARPRRGCPGRKRGCARGAAPARAARTPARRCSASRCRSTGSPTSCGTASRPTAPRRRSAPTSPSSGRCWAPMPRSRAAPRATRSTSRRRRGCEPFRTAREGGPRGARTRSDPTSAATRLRQALELWRGHPFAGRRARTGPCGSRPSGWRIFGCRRSKIESRPTWRSARMPSWSTSWKRLVREYPYRERLWRQLMLALYRAERQADALAAYRRARGVLDEELGLEPGEELQRLEQAILRHEVPPARPPEERHNLPAAVSSFVGRESELADVDRLLRTSRLVTLSGVGGVGKTRLALEAASRAIGESPDGVFLVDLSALTEPASVARQVVDRPRHPGAAGRPARRAARRAPARRGHADRARQLRAPARGVCRALRAPAWFVSAPSGARDQPRGTGRAGRGRLPGPAPAGSVARSRPRGAPRLGGRPSVHGPGERCAAAPVGGTRGVRDRRPGSAGTSTGSRSRSSWRPPGRRRSRSRRSRAGSTTASSSSSRGDGCHPPAIGRSGRPWTGATSCSRTRSGRCSVDCRCSPEASRSPPLPPSACPAWTAAPIDLVGRLVDASLVVPEERDGETRYRLLETVRQYAAERLESRGETADVRRRHADHFLTLAESAQTRGAGQLRGLRQLDADIDNLRTALDFAVAAGDAETELRFVAALWPYWHVRGHLAEGRDRLEAAIAREGATAHGAYTRAVYGAGILAWSIGDYGRVRVLAKELLDSSSGHRLTIGRARWVQAPQPRRRFGSAQFAAAERYSKRTLALARKLDSDHDVSTAQLNLAVVYLDWGKTEAAIPMLEDVLAYNRRNGITEGAGFALLNLGEADYHLGDFPRARVRFEEARAGLRLGRVQGARGTCGHGPRRGRGEQRTTPGGGQIARSCGCGAGGGRRLQGRLRSDAGGQGRGGGSGAPWRGRIRRRL